MIRKAKDCPVQLREHMRGGDGTVRVTQYVTPEELYGKGRLFSEIRLDPGCGIGEHRHEGEEEIFVVTEGTVLYNDNGTEYTCAVGDVMVCGDGESHSVRNEGNEPAAVTALIMLH